MKKSVTYIVTRREIQELISRYVGAVATNEEWDQLTAENSIENVRFIYDANRQLTHAKVETESKIAVRPNS